MQSGERYTIVCIRIILPYVMSAPSTGHDTGSSVLEQHWRDTLNEEYLERAKATVDDVRLLINGVSKRAAELSRGARPLVPTLPQDERSNLDIALLEVAEGKILIKHRHDD